MSMIVSLAGALLPCLACYLLLVACRPVAIRCAAERILCASLAIGLGLGCSSAGYFLWRLFLGTAGPDYLIADTVCWIGVVVLAATLFGRRRRRPVPNLALPPQPEQNSRLVRAACAALLLMTVAGAGLAAWASPQGSWDAWAIWNLRARALYRIDGVPASAWSAAYDHPDYPLLLPATIARTWTWLGEEADAAPAVIGLTFTLATAGLLVGGIGRLRGLDHGLLAGIVLFGTVRFVRWGTAQYADVPLSLFCLAAMILLAERDSGDKPSRWSLCFAGLAASLAAWTKNEGALFVVALLAARGMVQWVRTNRSAAWRDAALLLAGAAPVLLVLFLFKSQIQVDNDLVEGQAFSQTLARIADPARHVAILSAFGATGLHVASAFAVVLPLCALQHAARRAALLPLLVVAAMLAGYYIVYLTTPHDLAWHLETSLDRLFVQLAPMSLFVVFLNLRTANEVLSPAMIESPDSVWQGTANADYARHGSLANGPHSSPSRIRA
jgi:hypothetical protein